MSNVEVYFSTDRAADPVLLHCLNLVGPVERVDVFEEFIGVFGDFEEPLFHFLLFDFVAAAPTVAVFNLFVGEDGLVHGAPPLVGFFLVGEAFFVELEETPLGPFVILRVGSVYFARPIDGVTEAFGLFAEISDVLFGDFLRGGASLDGVILGGKTKSVVAEGAEDVEALLAVKSGEDVDDGEVADMADMETGAGRIGEHFGEEHFGFVCVFGSLEGLLGFPFGLPF